MPRRFPIVKSCLAMTLAVGAFSGCNKSDSDSAEAPAANAQGAAPSAPQTEEELSAVLATVDGVEITVAEFQDRINKQSPYIRARYTSNEQRREFLDNLVRFEVLAQQAQTEGYDKDIDVVRTMKQVMIQKLMKTRFEEGIRPEDIKEADMQAYFDSNPGEYNKPEEVRVSAIILDDAAKAKTVAKDALGEAGRTNKGFRELVVAHTTDEESKKRGGDLRYFSKESSNVPKEVIEAAFTLKKTGDVVGPISAGSAFYIIKQTGHRKAINKTFDEVKRQIQNRLYREMRTQAQKDYVEKLKASAKIEIFDDKLGTVQIDTSAPDEAAHGAHGHGGHMPPVPGHPAETLGNPASAPTQATPSSH